MVETRELEYFVAVAEELHFGRAAERLGIAAPPLSRAISQLERRIGVRLLERTSRRVSLTAAGTAFLTDSRKVLAAAEAAVRRAQRTGRPRLVAAVRSGVGIGLLAEILDTYGKPVELLFTTHPSAALRNGQADVAVCCETDDLDGLATTELAQEYPVALLPITHELSSRAAVTAADLQRDAAFTDECPAVALDEIVDRVALGRLTVIVGHSAAARIGPAVTAVPVVGVPSTALVLGRAAGTPSPELKAFERVVKDVAANQQSRLTGTDAAAGARRRPETRP